MATGISSQLTLQDIMAVMDAAIRDEKELAAGNIIIGSQQVVTHLLRAAKLGAGVDEQTLGRWWDEVGAQIEEPYRLQLTLNGSKSTVILPPSVACQSAYNVAEQISLGRALTLRLFEDWFATVFKGGESMLLDTRSITSLLEQAHIAVYVITRECVIADQRVYAMSQMPAGESFQQLLQSERILWPEPGAPSAYQFQRRMRQTMAPHFHTARRGEFYVPPIGGSSAPVVLGIMEHLVNPQALEPLHSWPLGNDYAKGDNVKAYPSNLAPNQRVICVVQRLSREVRVCEHEAHMRMCAQAFASGGITGIEWYVGNPDTLIFEV